MKNIPLFSKIRHILKKIPLIESFYDFLTTVFFPTYNEDGMRLFKNIDFSKDKDFIRGFNAAIAQDPKSKNAWRIHVTQWAGAHAINLDGDFVETGVNKASFSASVIEYVNFKDYPNKKFYLFDTFEGICKELVLENENAAYRHDYKDTYEFVKNTFKKLNNVIIVKGIVPFSLKSVEIEKIAYLSVDMNCAIPEKETLIYFWDKIVIGGIVILDDYCFEGRHLQKKYADEFAISVGHKILSLPTGQGILIKTF